MTAPPTAIRALRDERAFELCWPGGAVCRLPFRLVRGRCCCARCVDEITGVRVVDVDSVPAEIAPADVGFSGNYALKITWSDGHDTGLFTWEYLAELCRQEAQPCSTKSN